MNGSAARYRYRFGSKRRDALWAREAMNAYLAGCGKLPLCNICEQPVNDDGKWHESHDPAKPKCYGGKRVGIAHAACNLLHGAKVVTPLRAKAERSAARHDGRKGPGRGRYPMRAGRLSGESKTMRHGLIKRLSGAQKHARMVAKRYGAGQPAQGAT